MRTGVIGLAISSELSLDNRPVTRESFTIVCSNSAMYIQLDTFNPELAKCSREWVVSTLSMLAESAVSPAEAHSRGRWHGAKIFRPVKDLMRKSIIDDAERMASLLIRGVWVTECIVGTELYKTLYMSWKNKRVILGKKPIIDIHVEGNIGIYIDDIAEIRRGRSNSETDDMYKFRIPSQVYALYF